MLLPEAGIATGGCVIVRIVAGSIEQMLVDVFKQHVIVSVIHADSNQNRIGHFKCFAHHGANFFGGIDHL